MLFRSVGRRLLNGLLQIVHLLLGGGHRPLGGVDLLLQVFGAARALGFFLWGWRGGAEAAYLRLQELYQQREALEDELAHLYAVWEGLAADLEEARG